MSLFDIVLVQPIFNILVFIYGVIPGHDFGVALILFTIIIRIALWPLVRKQLHQTKMMRKLQPELQRIRKRAAGNRQLESQLMLELYRERGVKPFSSIGILILQLPIFIALFAVVRIITEDDQTIPKYTYEFLQNIPFVQNLVQNPHSFDESLFGLVNLSQHAIGSAGFYLPIFLLAGVAAVLQFFQSKQLLPQPKEKRKLRDLLKDQAAGKQVDQADMSAAMSGGMIYLFPALTFMVSLYLAGALVLYLVTTSAVAIFQQARVLREDTEDMEKISEKTAKKTKNAQEAEVVSAPKKTKKRRKK